MTDSVSFKAYLKRDGQEVEVRRFGVDGGAATSYMYLRSKIQAMFPSIQNDQFQVFWQDSDKDYIRVDSDEELLEALTSSNQQPLKVYIQVANNNSQGGATGSGSGTGARQMHPGVVCDGCEGAVVGFRYKCVTCSDFDLCSRCENNGLHQEHFMLRMPTPMDSFLHHPKFLRKLFSHPYKFHKRHGWNRPAPPTRGCGDSQIGAGRCPFSRRGEGPAGPAAAFAGVTDMFDFSALMEFIESLGVAAGEERANQSTSAGTTAAPNVAEQNSNQAPSSAQSQEPPRPQNERRTNSPAAEYLNNIGQMVASILDPLGIPPKKKDQAKAKFVKQVYKLQKCGSKHGWKHGKSLMQGFGKHHHHWHKHHGHGKPFRHGLGHSLSPKRGHSHNTGHSFVPSPEHRHGGPRLGSRFSHNLRGHESFPRSGYEVGCKLPELGLKHKHGFAHGPKHGHGGPRVGSRLSDGPSGHEAQSPEIVSIDDSSDIEIVFEDVRVDVTFDVRTKTTQPQQQQAANTTSPDPTPSAAPAQATTLPIPSPAPAPAQATTTPTSSPAPSTTPIPAPESEVPSTSSQTDVTPAATIETQTEPIRERRNSDDWTLINRESPTRSEAMDVDESRGAKPKTPPPSAAQDTPSPSAPPHTDDLSDAERRRIQEAIETFRAMGFNFNTNILRDLLKKQNCDILSVLEMMLAEKK